MERLRQIPFRLTISSLWPFGYLSQYACASPYSLLLVRLCVLLCLRDAFPGLVCMHLYLHSFLCRFSLGHVLGPLSAYLSRRVHPFQGLCVSLMSFACASLCVFASACFYCFVSACPFTSPVSLSRSKPLSLCAFPSTLACVAVSSLCLCGCLRLCVSDLFFM